MSGRDGIRGLPIGPVLAPVGRGFRLTLPREVRRRLELEVGDRIEFVVGPDGRIEIRAALPPASIRGGAWAGGGRHYIVSD